MSPSDTDKQAVGETQQAPSSAVVTVTEGTYKAPQARVLARARALSDPATIQLIRQTVAAECKTDPELEMFLELAARYDLDPFAKHIYAARIKGKLVIIVAKDGMLAIANRHPDYRGNAGDVVRANDDFDKWVDEETGRARITHKYGVGMDGEGKPLGTGSPGDPEARGPIVGAWAIVYREGREPTYAYAAWAAYNKGEFTWKSHPDAMMKKVPLVMALREAFSIGGVVGEGEVPEGNGRSNGLTDAPVDDYGQDPHIAAKITQLFDLLGYTQRKRTITLAGNLGTGLTDDERLQLVDWLLKQADEKGIEVPKLPYEDAIDGVATPI